MPSRVKDSFWELPLFPFPLTLDSPIWLWTLKLYPLVHSLYYSFFCDGRLLAPAQRSRAAALAHRARAGIGRALARIDIRGA